jgi:hypothetical protein
VDNPIAVSVIALYVLVIVLAGWVRFWTEPGFWLAVHTGRAFILQASTLTVGLGVSYLDQVRRAGILRSFLPSPVPKLAEDALTAPLTRVLSPPELVFLCAGVFVILYIMTGYNERNYLMTVGNPPHPRKYANAVNQEPTGRYKLFIVVCFWLGLICLLVAFYFLGISHGHSLVWYVMVFAVPAHVAAGVLLLLGPVISRLVRGTDARTQAWDIGNLGGQQQ